MIRNWTIVARALHWTDRDYEVANAFVRNAVRLLEDAALLQTYERFGTAFTLATLAFEEAGKVALKYWDSDDAIMKIGKNWTFHLRKQAAAGCLLLAEVAKEAMDKHPARSAGTFTRGRPEDEAELREQLARIMVTSKPARLMDLIAVHAVEKAKQSGFYADEWILDAGMQAFSPTDCAAVIDEARTAVRLLRSPDHLQIASAVYRTGPLREQLVESGKRFAKRVS